MIYCILLLGTNLFDTIQQNSLADINHTPQQWNCVCCRGYICKDIHLSIKLHAVLVGVIQTVILATHFSDVS